MTEEGAIEIPLNNDSQGACTGDSSIDREQSCKLTYCEDDVKVSQKEPVNIDDNSNCMKNDEPDNIADAEKGSDPDDISEPQVGNEASMDFRESPESNASDTKMEVSNEILDIDTGTNDLGENNKVLEMNIERDTDENLEPKINDSIGRDVKQDAVPLESQDKSSDKEASPGKKATVEASCSSQSNALQSVYFLKKFKWGGDDIQIVTQNENGPCPLLAIANVLVLSKRIFLPPMQECITASQLMEYIGDYILSVGPKNVDEAMILNYQQNMHDAISIMYKLQTGIDVNVKFTGPRDFEFTSECLVFDLLNIGLYHGWLVDPQDQNLLDAVGVLSYNQLVEKIIKSKESSAPEDAVSEGLLAESFLEGSASQLTYHGICELNNAVRDEELCVFFRNNHFGTLYKHKDELFLLVTDQGYLNESKIIWETLANVDGAGQFVDENFHTVGPLSYQAPSAEPKPAPPEPPVLGNQLSQEDKDYLIALSLQEENTNQQQGKGSNPYQNSSALSPQQQEANDLALAKKLQDEEQQFARQQQQQQRQRQEQQNAARQPQNQFQPHSHQVGIENQSVDNRNPDKCTIL